MSGTQFSLEKRTAFITGGNSGIGEAIARGFVQAGARVAIAGRNAQRNQSVRQALGDACRAFTLDVRDESQVVRVIAEVTAEFGDIDILVNNAGNYRSSVVVEKSLEAWRDVMDTHLTAAFLCSRECGRGMISRGSGKIINIGSMYSIFGAAGGSDYAAAKTGMLGLTRTLACELGRHGIQVNALLPGWVDTPMTADERRSDRGENIRRKTPVERWGEPDDMVGTAIFLASRASDFVTGTAIPVDGGYSISEAFS